MVQKTDLEDRTKLWEIRDKGSSGHVRLWVNDEQVKTVHEFKERREQEQNAEPKQNEMFGCYVTNTGVIAPYICSTDELYLMA